MKLLIQTTNQTIDVFEGESILDALRRSSINIRSSCGGFATCSDCIIKFIGDFNGVNSVNFDEKKLLGNVFHITKERLACQVIPNVGSGDEVLTVEIINLD